MTDNIIYRQAAESDIDRLIPLMNSQYARKKDENYFQWQFFHSYLPTALVVAETQNKIIGMFGLQKKTLSNNIIAGQLIDLLVTPNFRGQGVFEKMAETAFSSFNDLQILMVLPNEKGMRACNSKLNLKPIAKIDNLVLEKKNYKPLKDSNDTKKKFISFVKSEDYLNWRYRKHPDYEYEFPKEDDGKTAVIKIFRDPISGNSVGDIVDFYDVGGELPIKGIETLFSCGLSVIYTWALPHTNLFKYLIQAGFTTHEQPRYFSLKILDNKFDYLYNIKEWEIFPGDAELY
ncbi:MAG: GNAT family N-acetyltransferase [Candidatus Falkowbacteria bacterium]